MGCPWPVQSDLQVVMATYDKSAFGELLLGSTLIEIDKTMLPAGFSSSLNMLQEVPHGANVSRLGAC